MKSAQGVPHQATLARPYGMRFCALQPCSRISVEHKDEGALTGLRRVQGISPSLDISSSRIGISTRPLTMSVPSKPYFHNEAAAFAHLEGVLWPNGPVCPHCGSISGKHYDLAKTRVGLRKCSDCRKQLGPFLRRRISRSTKFYRQFISCAPARESRERTAGAPHPRRHVQERMVPFAIASAKRCATAHSLLWAVRVRLSRLTRRSLAASRALRPVRAGSP